MITFESRREKTVSTGTVSSPIIKRAPTQMSPAIKTRRQTAKRFLYAVDKHEYDQSARDTAPAAP